MTSSGILVITGPTCSGKTDVALHLADADSSIEIVNADASLLYRGFDIGTAKPDRETRERIPHHLIDILDPHQTFSAADYSRLARETIREIIARGKKPVVVGGTGFYIDALFDGIVSVEVEEETMSEAKARVKQEYDAEGFDARHEKLREIDPVLYKQIQRERNPLRLMRAWEHYYATGEPLGKARERTSVPFEYPFVPRVLEIPRPELWQRIEVRVDRMFTAGWLAEAEQLKLSGVTREMPAMRAIGYRELFEVLDGLMIMGSARERIIIRTRQYAKRQVTWMRKYLHEDNKQNGTGEIADPER